MSVDLMQLSPQSLPFTQCGGFFVDDVIEDMAGADEAAAGGHFIERPLASRQAILASATPAVIARTAASNRKRFILDLPLNGPADWPRSGLV
jgi:hypothetical protein